MITDFHNHLIPGVDDGAADAAESAAALATFHEQGVRTVVCTPHVSGALTADPAALAARLAELDRGWEALAAAASAHPAMRVVRGAEVMLDTPRPDLSDPRLRLGGTAFALVEFPFMSVPPNAVEALFALRMQGWTPVLAHPERYANAAPDLHEAPEWKRVGALLQVNAGSLLGRYGPDAARRGWGLVRAGLADYLCSDYHARGRCPVASCRALMEERGYGEQARLLTEENPARLLRGEAPLPVPPRQRSRPLWRRILGR
ncbi:MAG TPA: CpsB/CapC family capsule biosynthesis tyrosine phosphatase [Longimicrobium sp.]|jgi:protein-tyrosine phosphatase|uniref:CpsB/CapC family capsule biosynthesis tyrosine phosphatase n=1 Tax=Longimicrobium sp. TaxID=2029185 RepID=UPI002EDA6CB7